MPEFTEDDDCYLYVQRAAAHNAAHAIVAWWHGCQVRQVWLDDVVCGCDAVERDCALTGLARHIHAARAMERQCQILLAGPLAEAMFSPLPPQSPLAKSDLNQAKSMLEDLCGADADAVLASLRANTRALLSENSWSVAIAVNELLKRGSLDAVTVASIFNSLRGAGPRAC